MAVAKNTYFLFPVPLVIGVQLVAVVVIVLLIGVAVWIVQIGVVVFVVHDIEFRD